MKETRAVSDGVKIPIERLSDNPLSLEGEGFDPELRPKGAQPNGWGEGVSA